MVHKGPPLLAQFGWRLGENFRFSAGHCRRTKRGRWRLWSGFGSPTDVLSTGENPAGNFEAVREL